MGSLSRPNDWSYNPNISEQYQANLCSHSYSGDTYSRGHMIPNGSRDGIREMQLQTFHVTNSVPQRQNYFNGTIWSALEQGVQAEAKDEEIYVVTGVAFSKVGESKSISYITPKDDTSQQCAIPNYFYKLVLKVRKSGSTVTDAETVGFWFEHKDYSGNDYTQYSVSVDQVEAWTGFDFFVNLPDSVEASAETNSSWSAFASF
jgi:endonuclease G